jgi:hypothetical protein
MQILNLVNDDIEWIHIRKSLKVEALAYFSIEIWISFAVPSLFGHHSLPLVRKLFKLIVKWWTSSQAFPLSFESIRCIVL